MAQVELASCRECRTEQPLRAMPAWCERCGAPLARYTRWVDGGGLVWSQLFPRSTPPARKEPTA